MKRIYLHIDNIKNICSYVNGILDLFDVRPARVYKEALNLKTKNQPHQMSAGGDKMEIARRLRSLRLRCRLSMREAANLAGVAPSYVSGIERGRVSPTIATLRKILNAIGSNLGCFFAAEPAHDDKHVFRRQTMRFTADRNRNYTFILPRRKDIKVEMIEEEYTPGEKPKYEIIDADQAGYVIDGQLLLEIRGEKPAELRTGDAFYIPAGVSARGRCIKSKFTRLITVQFPPNY